MEHEACPFWSSAEAILPGWDLPPTAASHTLYVNYPSNPHHNPKRWGHQLPLFYETSLLILCI